MIRFTTGNLLEADVQALINTVNTVGVMGKGIALMFKERYDRNFDLYWKACQAKTLHTGKMFVTETEEFSGPKWIINFPTKGHWKAPSKMEWIVEGLADLKQVIREKGITSIAIPPLGSGNGGLDWQVVKSKIIESLTELSDVDVLVYEPTEQYQNVTKREGVQKLTPARALIAELVRRYWILGIECSYLEVHKLAWFLERAIERVAPDNPLDLQFEAKNYGPYADRLRHLLNGLDGSYLHSDKRVSDSSPLDVIWFDDDKKDYLSVYLNSAEVKPYIEALNITIKLIDGFESPFGMELLATTDWLLSKENYPATVEGIKKGMENWTAGTKAAARKVRIFDVRSIGIALKRLTSPEMQPLHPQY